MANIFKYVVSMRDVDATGFVFHPRYCEFFSAARESFAKNNNIEFNKLINLYGVFFVVHSLNIQFSKSAQIGDCLKIHTKIIKCNAQKLVLNQEIYVEENLRYIVSQQTTLVCLNSKTKELVAFPNNLSILINNNI
jgi:YbgC/YbaW family acyl-CoA thioester hydrolase